ncbi:MAG: LysR substrate-binding domain-containing protein [Pseudomonadota bacterium]
MISFKQITYALAVERHLHFRRAAEECSISQSALSTALSEMEKQLGFQVFERDNKKVLVTAMGQQVLDKARSIKVQMDDLHRLADAHRRPLSTPMSIGFIPTIGPFLLPVVLPELQSGYPDLELSVSEERSHLLVEAVRNGTLDAAVIALPYRVDGLLTFKFWEENFHWVTHLGDSKGDYDRIGADDIESARLMLLKEGHCLKDHALAVCKLTDVAPHSLGATSLATLVQLVAGSIGSTLVPQMALEPLIEVNPKVTSVPLSEPGPHREIAFIVRPNYPSLRNIELLMELFGATLRERFPG